MVNKEYNISILKEMQNEIKTAKTYWWVENKYVPKKMELVGIMGFILEIK